MIPFVRRVLKDGRIRIHWFERLPDGPIKTGALTSLTPSGRPLVIGGATGRIACMPGLDRIGLVPMPKTNQLQLVEHSDDVRAVTCPECMATEGYKEVVRAMADVFEDKNDPDSEIQVMAGKIPAAYKKKTVQ